VDLGVLELVEQVGGVEQGLGRDAAAMQAGPAEKGSFSMIAVLRPSWPARIAAT